MVCGNRKVLLSVMPLSLPRRHALYAATRASAYLSYYTRPHVWPRVVHTTCYAATRVAAYPSRPRGAYALTRVDTYITKANIRADTCRRVYYVRYAHTRVDAYPTALVYATTGVGAYIG